MFPALEAQILIAYLRALVWIEASRRQGKRAPPSWSPGWWRLVALGARSLLVYPELAAIVRRTMRHRWRVQ